LGEVAELGALGEIDDWAVIHVDLHGGGGGVDGVLERPGGLLGEADLGVGITALQVLDQVGYGDPVFKHGRSSIRGAGSGDAGRVLG
jgi:hypothetical protein